MNAVQHWVKKARNANIRCIWPRTPSEKQASLNLRAVYMEAARKAKAKGGQEAVSRHATMRHTDVLCALSGFHLDKSVAGANLASEIETLISFEHLTADELRTELAKALATHKADRDAARAKHEARAKAIETTIYTDAS